MVMSIMPPLLDKSLFTHLYLVHFITLYKINAITPTYRWLKNIALLPKAD
ncbi:Uncharacterised protein [Cedecea neteri]|uniref:Uncharacterized protein n=1 Tax=Cedecea neteri TaxID=158822 RepID=A0A2X2SWA7_9ENTR|nr:Uncharacterised protein [Cedecea neteri]